MPHDVPAIASLALILREAETTQKLGQLFSDAQSPFNQPGAFQFNTQSKRVITWSTEAINSSTPSPTITAAVTYPAAPSPTPTYTIQVGTDTYSMQGTLSGEQMRVSLNGSLHNEVSVVFREEKVAVFVGGEQYSLILPRKNYGGAAAAKGSLLSPMPGRVVKIMVQRGEHVTKGQALMIMEAMKMEHTIRSPVNGEVEKIFYGMGDLVQEKQQLLGIKEDE